MNYADKGKHKAPRRSPREAVPYEQRVAAGRVCVVPSCGLPEVARGWCSTHYHRWRRTGDPQESKPVVLRLSLEERFWAKVDRTGECWLWMGARNGARYGRFSVGKRQVPAHRYAWELANGRPMPESLVACHHCDNPPCVRPSHIFAGTHQENMADAKAKGRLYAHPLTSECLRGHPRTEENTRIVTDRTGLQVRQCRACDRARRRERS